jgi:hypothetical protein
VRKTQAKRRLQGRKPSRIKPVAYIPPHPTRHHKKVDQALSVHEQTLEEHARAERREQAHREAKAARRAENEARRQPHRHHYRKLLRVTDEGNRVVACNCGAYILIEGVVG